MFVRTLTGPEDNKEVEHENPSSSDILSAIRSLDGEHCTLVTMYGGDEWPHMSVGGGSQFFIVYATFDNERYFTAISRGNVEGTHSLVAGGQTGIFQARQCVPLAVAEQAALTFAATGELDATIEWEEDTSTAVS